MSLPRVNHECCGPVEREIGKDDFLTVSAKHLVETNPTIAGVLSVFIERMPECCKKAAMLGVFMTYRLLENQDECDRLEKELNGMD
jgi:hypothetical protein